MKAAVLLMVTTLAPAPTALLLMRDLAQYGLNCLNYFGMIVFPIIYFRRFFTAVPHSTHAS